MHEALAKKLLQHSKQTSYAQAAASLARVQFASSCDPTLVQEDRHLLGLSKAAAFGGNDDVLLWAQAEAGTRWSGWLDDLCMAAAAGRQLATFQWLRIPADNLAWGTECALLARAARAADLATLQWLLEIGLPDYQWSNYDLVVVAGSAAAVEAIDVLDWLSAQPVFTAASWDDYDVYSRMADASARFGAVLSLQWLAAQGMHFDEPRYPTIAAESSQFAALQYLIEDANCPWISERVRSGVLRTASGQQLQWLRQADAAVWTPAVLSDMLCKAGTHSNIEAAEWLRAQGAAWPASFLCSGEHGKMVCWGVEMIQWALARGCLWGSWSQFSCQMLSDSSEGEADHRALQDTIMWAHAAGCPCDSKLHQLAAGLRATGASSGASSGSSGGRRERWNALLFELFYTSAGQTRLRRGLRFTVFTCAALAALCVLAALSMTSSAQRPQLEGVCSVSAQPFTGIRQQSPVVAAVDSGSQQYSDYSLQDYSVQQLSALLAAAVHAARARGQMAEAEAAEVLTSIENLEIMEQLRERTMAQLADLTERVDVWKQRAINVITILGSYNEHGEESLSQ
jgi:hypothetical protein